MGFRTTEIRHKNCLNCGVLFTIKKGDRDYCTNYCKIAPIKNTTSECVRCGTTFRTDRRGRKYCSAYCRTADHIGTKIPSRQICRVCNQEKPKVDMDIRIRTCHICFCKENPKWTQEKKEGIEYFIEIENFLKKIHLQKYRCRYEDMLMIVHWRAEVDYYSTRATVDDMFMDIQSWYRDKVREIFRTYE